MDSEHANPLRILIAEDEMHLAMLMEDVLTEAGYCVRKAARLSGALALASTECFDAAVLDVNLAGEKVFPLAAELRARNVPFMFASGYGDAAIPPEYKGCPVLQKPYGLKGFKQALQALLASAGVT